MMTSMRLIAAYINGVVVADSDVATAADAGDITMDIWYNADDDTATPAAPAAAEDDIVDDDYDDEGDEAEVIAKHTTYSCSYRFICIHCCCCCWCCQKKKSCSYDVDDNDDDKVEVEHIL